MAERLSIIAEPRKVVGKKVKQLRRDGIIPGIIYGQSDPQSIQMNNIDLRRVLRASSRGDLLNVELEGNKYAVLVRDIQQHLTRGDLIHIDFLEVNMKETVTSTASLVAIGESQIPAAIGVSALILFEIDIEALPDDLISEIQVDMTAILKPSDQITVGDLPAPDGVTILTDPDTLVGRVRMVRIAEEEEEEEIDGDMGSDAGSPEVIGRATEEDEI